MRIPNARRAADLGTDTATPTIFSLNAVQQLINSVVLTAQGFRVGVGTPDDAFVRAVVADAQVGALLGGVLWRWGREGNFGQGEGQDEEGLEGCWGRHCCFLWCGCRCGEVRVWL
jgi:hypothetical protein